MTEKTSYAAGTPSWIDIGVPDAAAAGAFYGGLFGWTLDIDPRPEAGGYGMFKLRGLNVAGLGPQMNTEMPPFWSVYVTVASLEDSLALSVANGGTTVMPAMDVLDVGRMAIIQDPMRTFISLWQPLAHHGCDVVNETGAFTWNELSTPDVAASTAFYAAVFGWGIGAEGSSDQGTLFTLDGEMLCGSHQAGEGEFPSWSVWFSVEDCDASAALVASLGGRVIVPPNDMGFGRGAVVADPAGAVFGIGAMGG